MVERSKRFDRIFRRVVPSTATLSYNSLFRLAGRVSDTIWNAMFHEFRCLPPNHLRVRVGVGNQVFRNQVLCLKSGWSYWLNAFANGFCRLDSNIVEIGCGYGRKAYPLLEYETPDSRFTGHYHGVDIDEELLAFARSKFPSDQFSFQLTPHKSQTYGATQGRNATHTTHCQIDANDATQDFVFSTSLFTHLLEPELIDYIRESYRILRPGGWTQMNFFCHDYMLQSGHIGSRWTFKHRQERAFIESEEFPEAAVAYTSEAMKCLYHDVGFERVEIVNDPDRKLAQSIVRAGK